MSTFDRIRRIAKANINWLLDKVEPPKKELESKIKELEDTILAGRESAAMYGATFKRLESDLHQLQEQQKQYDVQARNALKTGDEKAARDALDAKIKVGERISQISPAVDQGRRTFEKVRENLAQLQQQLKTAKLRLHDLNMRKNAADAQLAFDEQLGKSATLDPAGQAFERLEEDVLHAEARVEVNQEINGDSFDADMTERARTLQIEAEMQAIKEELETE